jgi:hypothetical protein
MATIPQGKTTHLPSKDGSGKQKFTIRQIATGEWEVIWLSNYALVDSWDEARETLEAWRIGFAL